MGHGIKTGNRGDAIARNKQRLEAWVKEAKGAFRELRKADGKSERRIMALGERLDTLEVFMEQSEAFQMETRLALRPWWRKVGDWWSEKTQPIDVDKVVREVIAEVDADQKGGGGDG